MKWKQKLPKALKGILWDTSSTSDEISTKLTESRDAGGYQKERKQDGMKHSLWNTTTATLHQFHFCDDKYLNNHLVISLMIISTDERKKIYITSF